MSETTEPAPTRRRPRTLNKLDRKQAYRLTQWIDSQRDLIARQGWSLSKVAAESARSLDLIVTPANVRAAAATLDLAITSDDKSAATRRLITELVKRIDGLEAKVRKLQGRVGDLESQLGVQPMATDRNGQAA